MVCNMYKGGKWYRYVEGMCTHRDKEGVCLAAFFIYQVALVYVWILFLLSTNDIETFYCPNKITGKVFAVYLNYSTNE